MVNVAISAGEISGEEHLSRVLKYIKDENINFFGMGSDILKNSGVDIIIDSKKWCNLNGFNIPLILYKSLYALFIFVFNLIKKKPKVLILVDYPDFNLRLAFFAKLLNIKVIYFIPPKLWAWRKNRIKKIKKYVDQIIVIFPFEVDFYKNEGFNNVLYFGHPFSDILNHEDKTKTRLELGLKEKSTIALFPGSRRSEVNFLINILNNVSEKYKDYQLVLSVARNFKASELITANNITLIENQSIKVMQASDFGILKCGTCNLEAAYIELPHTVIYKTSKIAAYIIRKLVNIKFYSLVNIILPNSTKELIQEDCNSESIILELDKIIANQNYREKQIQSFKKIKEILGYQSEVSKNISENIVKFIYEK